MVYIFIQGEHMAGRKKEKKVDRIVIPCTVSFKKKYMEIVSRVESDQAGFGMAAITEKIKNDKLGDE